MALERGKPPANDPPYKFKVYSEIFVDEHIANMLQVNRFVLHRGCASFKIRSRR